MLVNIDSIFNQSDNPNDVNDNELPSGFDLKVID